MDKVKYITHPAINATDDLAPVIAPEDTLHKLHKDVLPLVDEPVTEERIALRKAAAVQAELHAVQHPDILLDEDDLAYRDPAPRDEPKPYDDDVTDYREVQVREREQFGRQFDKAESMSFSEAKNYLRKASVGLKGVMAKFLELHREDFEDSFGKLSNKEKVDVYVQLFKHIAPAGRPLDDDCEQDDPSGYVRSAYFPEQDTNQ